MRISTLLAGSVAGCLMTFGSAHAADAIVDEPVAAATVYNWSGMYIGVFGALSSSSEANFNIGFIDNSGSIFNNSRTVSSNDKASGFSGGAQIGYDYQFSNNIVIGAIADIAASDINSDHTLNDSLNGAGPSNAKIKLDYLGTVRGRVGYAFDRALIYAHGGLAYGDVKVSGTVSGNDFSSSDTQTGYVVGAGMEYAFTQHMSFQAEYSYTDLGSNDFGVSSAFANGFSNGFGGPADVHGSDTLKFHTLKVGLNYRF